MKNHIELPLYVKQWYFFRAVVRTISLLYMMYGWYMSKDFSFVPWVVVIWNIFTNTTDIWITHHVGRLENDLTQFYSAVVGTLLWIVLALLKWQAER